MKKIIAILLLVFSSSAIADPMTIICDYPTWSDQEGRHKAKDKFVLTFIVDKDADKAYMMGKLGTTEIIKMETPEQMAFLEITDTANTMATVITKDLKSVHSRHSVLFGNLIPSQYYGACEIK